MCKLMWVLTKNYKFGIFIRFTASYISLHPSYYNFIFYCAGVLQQPPGVCHGASKTKFRFHCEFRLHIPHRHQSVAWKFTSRSKHVYFNYNLAYVKNTWKKIKTSDLHLNYDPQSIYVKTKLIECFKYNQSIETFTFRWKYTSKESSSTASSPSASSAFLEQPSTRTTFGCPSWSLWARGRYRSITRVSAARPESRYLNPFPPRSSEQKVANCSV